MVEEHWNVDAEEINQDFNNDFDGVEQTESQYSSISTISKLMCVFLMLWASFYGISATALNHLIQFFHYVLSAIAPYSPAVADVAAAFPTSLYMLKKHFKLKGDPFDKYVICQNCGSLYQFKECLNTTISGKIFPKVCSHVAFRNHPHLSGRTPCGHNLLKEVITLSGKKYYPLKSYCYYPLVRSLTNVLNRADLLEQCEHWRSRNIPNNVLADVYDGKVWREFLNYKGKEFLSKKYNLGLMMNCDWFQPFDHSTYSVGVLYLVILNLPRAIRFKPENILIAGIIPGPSEPSYTEINSYLRPLVKELNSLWTDGFTVKDNIIVRAALLASVCDVPATAKLGGFLSHTSKHACWKCSKLFPYDETLNRVDFAGVELGSLRKHDIHKKNARDTLDAVTKTQRSQLESDNGSRFTQLMHLPYYDCIRFAIIDPMHNLFLGTPKRLLREQWMESGLIPKNSLDEIQNIVQKCNVPSNVGRIPHKIASAFASLTADEWKNWTLLFSLIALHDVLPQEHLECWQTYVMACNIYCSSVISLDEINSADELMRSFFIKAESLYGSRFLTINAHLHLHLQNVFKDYGPCYGYWLFSFERYNGILGRYHTNQLSIEIQLMRRFIENMHIKSTVNTDSFPSEHLSILSSLLGARSGGTATKTLFGQSIFASDECLSFQEYANVELSPPFVLHYFDSVLLSYLRLCYQKIIPDVDVLEVPQLCRKYKYATWWSQHLNSSKKTPLCVLAKWIGEDGEINCDKEICAGIVKYFFTQRLLVGNDYVEVN